jgi:hypothetical protein
MYKKQFLIVIISVLFSSFLGGAFVQFISHAPAVIAEESVRPSTGIVIKATKILLTNQKGQIRASLSLENPELTDEYPALKISNHSQSRGFSCFLDFYRNCR